MNPWKLSCHHGFFKSPSRSGQRRRQGNHVLHVHAPLVESSMISWLQALRLQTVVRYQHTRHACRSIFPPAWRPKYRAQIAVQTDERLVQQGKVTAARQQAQKCYPVRHAAGQFGRIFVQIARSQPDFRRQRDDFAFIGFVHKDSDILHRGQFSGGRFPETENPFCGKFAYRADFGVPDTIRHQTVVLPQPLGPNKAFTSPVAGSN